MTTAELEDIREKQTIFFNGNFKQYLRESAEEIDDFLVKFVECATGSNYLPFDRGFKINLEFDLSLDPLGNPMFHSCTHDIRISLKTTRPFVRSKLNCGNVASFV